MTKEEYLNKIAKEAGIPKEEIAGVFTDEEEGKRMIFKRDQVINQLQRIAPKINESFDKVYIDEFKSISSDLSEAMPLIYVGHRKALAEKDELRSICGDLLRNAANTILSSVQTLRCGFRLQSGILLRSVIEMCATVTHLNLDSEALNDFKNDKLKSTYSISRANKEIPIYGHIWGILSNKQIHINSLHSDWYPLQEYTGKEEIPVEVTIGIIGVTIMILRITTELNFYHVIDEHLYWKNEGDNKVSFIPPEDDNIAWIREKLYKD